MPVFGFFPVFIAGRCLQLITVTVMCLLQLYVLVFDKLTSNEYLWTKAKFLNRQAYMQEMYGTFEHTGRVPNVPQVTETLTLSQLSWYVLPLLFLCIYF